MAHGGASGRAPDCWASLGGACCRIPPGLSRIPNGRGSSRGSAQQFIIDELSARLDKAKSLRVDAIEFDNVDANQNKTGLTISAATQEQFDAAIANLVHRQGFRVGLKIDLGHSRARSRYGGDRAHRPHVPGPDTG